MTVRDVVHLLEEALPPDTAQSWDHIGLQVGDPRAEVRGCLVALDATVDTVVEARRNHAGLIIAHHPVLFSPLNAVTADAPVGRTVMTAIRQGVSIYVAHTNLDASAELGTSAALADRLGLRRGPVLCPCGPAADGTGGRTGLGMVCETPEMRMDALAEYVAGRLASPSLALVGDGERTVRRLALLPGSGGGLIGEAAQAADALLTGEMKYHDALEADQRGLAVLAAGHYDTERPVLDGLARFLGEAFGPDLGVAICQTRTDPVKPWRPDRP